MIKRIIALIVTAAAILGLAWFAPKFTILVGDLPQASMLKVKAQDLSLVCPGGVYRTGGTSGTKVGSFEPVGNPEINSNFGGPAGTSMVISGDRLTASDPNGIATQNSLLLNANQIQSVASDGLGGLTGAACQRPTNSIWLVGGDTSTGRESLLILKNTAKVDSTVNLEIFSERGAVTGSGLSGISVAAGKTTVVPMASFVPKTASFTTHVVSRGGLVAAWIQQKTIHGLATGGVDYVSPSADFATTQVIPGLFIRGSAEIAKLAGNPDYSDIKPTLRIFVPGAKPATFTAQVLGSTAKTFGTVVRQTVAGGATADISLSGLADGDFVVMINSDQPVGASVRVHRLVGKMLDFAWLNSATAQTGEVGFSVPTTGISKLSLANPTNSAVALKLTQGSSAVSNFNIPADGQLTLKFAPGTKIKLAAAGQAIYGTTIVDLNGSIAAIGLVDYQNSSGQVAVMVR